MDVRLPDGTVIQNVPDNMTRADLVQKLKANGYDTSQLEQQAPKGTLDTIRDKLRPTPLGRVIQGMRDPIDAGAQLLPRALEAVTSAGYLMPNPVSNFFGQEARRVDAMNADAEQEYQAARRQAQPQTLSGLVTGQKPDPGFDGYRLLGNVVSPVNAAAGYVAAARAVPTTAGALAKFGATTGAVGGLLTPVNEMQDGQSFGATKAAQVALGAGTGAVLTPALGAVTNKAVSYLQRKLTDATTLGAKASIETDMAIQQAMRDVGMSANDIPQNTMDQIRTAVLDAFKQGKRLDPAAKLREQDFKTLGMVGPQVGPLKGQLTRDPAQFAEEMNLRAVPGVGTPLLTRLNNQNRFLSDKLNDMGAINAAEPYRAGVQAVSALEKVDDELKQGIRAAYNAARQSAGKDMDVPLTGLAQDYAETMRNFGDKVPSGVRNNFEELGLLSGKQSRTFTIEDADRLLKVINANVSNDPATNAALDTLRNSVKRAIIEGPADDVFAPARKLAAQRFDLMDMAPALKQAAKDSLSADDFVNRFVIRGKVDDLGSTLRLLDQDTQNQLRAQVVNYLRRAAYKDSPDKNFAPDRFREAVRAIGSDKLKLFLSPQEVEQVKAMARVGGYMFEKPGLAPVLGNPNMFWAAPVMSKLDSLPYAGPLLSFAKGAAQRGNQNATVNAALSPTVKPVADVPAELQPYLPMFLSGIGLNAGALGASPLR